MPSRNELTGDADIGRKRLLPVGGGFQDPSRVPFGPVSPRQVSQRDGPRSHWRWFRVATHPITATKNLQVTSSGISNIWRIRRQSECAQECSSNRLARHTPHLVVTLTTERLDIAPKRRCDPAGLTRTNPWRRSCQNGRKLGLGSLNESSSDQPERSRPVRKPWANASG